ncbi:cyclophilin-like fold protein [Candidatus Methanocrinis natronophilus]|uniref:Cyclophilin-like fold protein n=1 Tax=Candidatus Methanocrinis natronophilus TaxID=3033396 RepID=A0ABT5X9K2_9EURY|nr:cyclophilin-like fold protein [Candidatus Methanocrinis natronophilus]MDF0591328.1 cyclophilin-like fold protein [Candidatus Methanocrinis natronophilus]
MNLIEIVVEGKGSALAEIDGRNPRTAREIYERLPLEAKAQLWGDEVYFELPFALTDENPSPSSEAGDVSFWTPGSAFCIFFGGTQPYSAVNHIGRIVSGIDVFPGVEEGDRIILRQGEG